MRLNHRNLCIVDLAQACALFEGYFGFEEIDRKGDVVAVLRGQHDFLLVLSRIKPSSSGAGAYPDGFHIGFIQDTPAQVELIHSQLVSADVQLAQGPRKIRDSYGFYFTALEGLMFEVTCPL